MWKKSDYLELSFGIGEHAVTNKVIVTVWAFFIQDSFLLTEWADCGKGVFCV